MGPIDGHDVEELRNALRKALDAGRPVVLLPGDTFRVDSLIELEAVAREALRRRLEGYGEEVCNA